MSFDVFKNRLEKANTEEAVKAAYASYFKLEYETSQHHDLYTPNVLFEFKTDKDLSNLKALASTLAQTLYYIRRLKYMDIGKPIPFFVCLADKQTAAIAETQKWSQYYSSEAYDWERAASKPDPKLIDHLVKEPETAKIPVYAVTKKQEHEAFKKNLENALNPQMLLDFGDKKVINEENFEAVYEHWRSVIGPHIINGYKPSFYFLSNIQRDKIILDRDNNKVSFSFEDKNSRTQKILMKDYDRFWGIYDYVEDAETIQGIHAKLDRLTDESQRRFEGEFYTPLPFAKKAVHYLQKVLGKNWYKSGQYRIWDMAAGTGNLEYHLPAEAYQYLYMSTLHSGEVDHLKKLFPGATCFQYDYLNDDVEYLFLKDKLPFEPQWKLPKQLRQDLANPDLTWIVYINPPFATAQVGGAKGDSKQGVSKTRIDVLMNQDDIGHAKRELFTQFMYRINLELPKKTYLAMFSKLKYLNAPDSLAYRDKFFNVKYEKGFLFKSTNFHGVKGKYPISFLVWDLSKPRRGKTIKIDILNDQTEYIGTKHLRLLKSSEVLNNWFERPKNSQNYILPPLSNGLTVKRDNKDKRHRARPDFLASICSKGNDFQNNKYVTILSSPSVSAGAFSVIPANFEQAMTLHAVKKIPKPTWLNDRNQFLIPQITPSAAFMTDCVVWSLFANSNESTALKQVAYGEKMYDIKNQLYPFRLAELKQWEIRDSDLKMQLLKAEERFVAQWLAERSEALSAESRAVLEAARAVYRLFYASLNQMLTHTWKIETWDAGWYQIRRCLTAHNLGAEVLQALKEAHEALAAKILPDIEHYGFMDKDEIFEDV